MRSLTVRGLAAAAALAVTSTPTNGQPALFHKHDAAKASRVTLRAPAADMPLQLLGPAGGRLPVVEAYVNGKGPFRFGIETGAQFAAVSPRLADTLGLPAVGRGGMHEYRVDSLVIGALVFESLPVTAVRTAAQDIDGFLGFPIYNDLLVTLDYPAARIRFERGALPAPNGKDVLPLRYINDGDFIGIPMRIGQREVTALIDTRSTGGISFTPESAGSLPFAGPLEVIGTGRGAAIGPTEIKGARVDADLQIGVYRLVRPFVSVRPLPPRFPTEPLIGTQVLHEFAMTLDQKNGRVRLARSGSNVIELPEPVAAVRRVAPAAGGADTGAVRAYVALNPKDFVGTWGDRTVTFEDEEFYLQRPGGAKYRMRATGRDRFTLKDLPEARYEFVRDSTGRVVQLRARNQDGVWETVTRTRPD